jgi:AcrR family transcriptional regulator
MEKPKKSKDYHHGDLRRAVIKAAFALVRKRGLRELTLREVARKIGVTHAAPYHHFKDRDALLSAMAEEAFGELDLAMRQSKEGVLDPSRELFVLGRAYVDFAREKPERVQVMFQSGGGAKAAPLGAEGQGSFQHLVDAITRCQAAGVAPLGDAFALALSAWSLVHGFALLWVEGPLEAMEPYTASFETLRDGMLNNFSSWLRAAAQSAPRNPS